MIYLDYSATTFPEKEVLKEFLDVANNYNANPNSHYDIAYKAYKKIEEATSKIASYLKVFNDEIIFTSGASESNNQAIKKVAMMTNKRHIITTRYEHSSVLSPISYLQTLGYHVSFVEPDENGVITIDSLKSLITEDTFLVSIAAVNSELGFRQPIEEIGKFLKDYDIVFHSDITQCLGKDYIDLTNVDLASFSAHKIFGIKGIGGLVKKRHIKILPLINGGKSTTIYRSGTPQTELICSMAKAMDLCLPHLDKNIKKVAELNKYLMSNLEEKRDVVINSTSKSIYQIINFSILNKKADDIQTYFASKKIYFSTKTACSSDESMSRAVLDFTKDENRAKSSVRISISYKTSLEEIKEFLNNLNEYLEEK